MLAAGSPVAHPPVVSAQQTSIAYSLHIRPTDTAHIDVDIRFGGAPEAFRLAMKVHAEYDAHYWRYLSDVRVDGSADDGRAAIERKDSTLWSVSLPGGRGTVHYRIRVPPDAGPGLRRAWHVYVRTDGASINPPDVFLYSPDFPHTRAQLDLDVPATWRVATALPASGSSFARVASDAITLLDSPIMMGGLQQWSFLEGGALYRVVYWPLPPPQASTFDTIAFVSQLRAVVQQTMKIFGTAPFHEYEFLIQDGAGDALEHAASLTIGVPSSRLARDPGGSLAEITHELFHSWNLVAIRPAGYNDLSYLPPSRTPGLWLGEGVTLYYADALPRRAGLAGKAPSRLAHLDELLERYFASPAITHVPPSRASLAFGDSPLTNPDATGGYYLQGELLGVLLDALIRDSTKEARGLDDLMRALYEKSQTVGYHGYGPADVRAATDSVCTCDLSPFFNNDVDGIGPIAATPTLSRLGLRFVLDSMTAVDSIGRPLPDLRLSADFTAPPEVVRLVITNSATAWARAGLESGDEVLALNGVRLSGRGQLYALLGQLRLEDTAQVDVRRKGAPLRISVLVGSYVVPRVRFVDAPTVTDGENARRRRWMEGW
jgi:predicted metalloprotease with PDZ domain